MKDYWKYLYLEREIKNVVMVIEWIYLSERGKLGEYSIKVIKVRNNGRKK